MSVMTDNPKPIVRLAHTSGNVPTKGLASQRVAPTVKLAVRLNEGINEALRATIRYRGDLSTLALEALASVDLVQVPLVSADERMVRDTTITMPRILHKE